MKIKQAFLFLLAAPLFLFAAYAVLAQTASQPFDVRVLADKDTPVEGVDVQQILTFVPSTNGGPGERDVLYTNCLTDKSGWCHFSEKPAPPQKFYFSLKKANHQYAGGNVVLVPERMNACLYVEYQVRDGKLYRDLSNIEDGKEAIPEVIIYPDSYYGFTCVLDNLGGGARAVPTNSRTTGLAQSDPQGEKESGSAQKSERNEFISSKNDVALEDIKIASRLQKKSGKTTGSGQGLVLSVTLNSTWLEKVYLDTVMTNCNFLDKAFHIQKTRLTQPPGRKKQKIFYELKREELELVRTHEPFQCTVEIMRNIRKGSGEDAKLVGDGSSLNNALAVDVSWKNGQFTAEVVQPE